MKSIVFLLLLAACSAQPLENRVVGGVDALPGQFPYTVSIQIFGMHNCGGAIIADRWIVTAAHCLDDYPKELLTIVTGATKLSDGGDVYQVSKSIYHKQWNTALGINDIGLVMTDRDIQFGDNVKVMLLGSEEVPAGKKLMLSGWGLTKYPGEGSDHLQFIELTSISINTCTTALKPTLLFNTQLCTYNKRGEGACKGDSGGPLVYKDQLVGIVSFGQPCAIGKPDVFTKVSAYLPWIFENMK